MRLVVCSDCLPLSKIALYLAGGRFKDGTEALRFVKCSNCFGGKTEIKADRKRMKARSKLLKCNTTE